MAVLVTNLPCRWCMEWPCRCDVTRTERCACGAYIVARVACVTEDVAAHNTTEKHLAWRRSLT